MSEKTFEPTGRRLEELRKRGEVVLSPDLTGAITLLLATYVLASKMGAVATGLVDLMRHSFTSLAKGPALADVTAQSLQVNALNVINDLAGVWMPFLLTLFACGVIVTLAQTRGLIASQRIRPDFARLNPVSGIKRMFSGQGFFETGKGLVKMIVLSVVLYAAVRESPERLTEASLIGIRPAMTTLGGEVLKVARQAALVLVLIGVLDYVYKRRQFKQRTKMTREEVTEEMKNAEGQPMLKNKIRELQRRMSRGRMMAQVAKADVIVTNPTHLAIAIKYDAKTMAAPIVLAKGRDLVAQEIVRRAKQHGILIVQNIPLAHALIKVELDAVVPPTLYHAVAEVLAFVYRVRRGKPAGRSLR